MNETVNDHDLLIELKTEFKGMRADIQALTDTTKDTISDHEMRIRSLEISVTTVATEKKESERFTRTGGAILIFLVGIVEFLISHFF